MGRVLRGREHTAAHDHCIHLITTLSAYRRRCKTSLPMCVDAESLTWDMGRGPPVAPALWVQAPAVVIHGAVGLVPVEIELVSCVCPLEPLSFCLWQLGCNPSPKESFVGRFRHTVAPLGAGTARCPSTSCRALYSCRYKIWYALVLRLECPTSHHQPIAPCQRQDSRPHYSLCACEVGPSSSSRSAPLCRRMARRMPRYEDRESSGQDRTGQDVPWIATDDTSASSFLQTRNHRSHTAHLSENSVPKANRAHRADGAAGARLVDLPVGWLRKKLSRLSSASGWLTLRGTRHKKPNVLVLRRAESGKLYRESLRTSHEGLLCANSRWSAAQRLE